MTRVALLLAAAVALAGCHLHGRPRVPPGHGGVPPGQAKKVID